MFECVESFKDYEKKLILQLLILIYRFSLFYEYFYRIEVVESVLFVLFLQFLFYFLLVKESLY